MTGYTYVMMLIVSKKWRKPLNNFYALGMKFFSNFWITCYAWMGAHMSWHW
jgi:hypothetical protein